MEDEKVSSIVKQVVWFFLAACCFCFGQQGDLAGLRGAGGLFGFV